MRLLCNKYSSSIFIVSKQNVLAWKSSTNSKTICDLFKYQQKEMHEIPLDEEESGMTLRRSFDTSTVIQMSDRRRRKGIFS